MKKIYLIFILGIIILFPLINASVNFDFKWQLCDSMNFSGKNCDLWWEEFKNVMGITETSNQTLKGYYNKSIIDEKLSKINVTTIVNASMVQNAIISCFSNIDECFVDFDKGDKPINENRAKVLFQSSGEIEDENNSSSNKFDLYIIGIIIIVGILIVVLIIFGSKINFQRPPQRSYNPVSKIQQQPKILPRQKYLGEQIQQELQQSQNSPQQQQNFQQQSPQPSQSQQPLKNPEESIISEQAKEITDDEIVKLKELLKKEEKKFKKRE